MTNNNPNHSHKVTTHAAVPISDKLLWWQTLQYNMTIISIKEKQTKWGNVNMKAPGIEKRDWKWMCWSVALKSGSQKHFRKASVLGRRRSPIYRREDYDGEIITGQLLRPNSIINDLNKNTGDEEERPSSHPLIVCLCLWLMVQGRLWLREWPGADVLHKHVCCSQQVQKQAAAVILWLKLEREMCWFMAPLLLRECLEERGQEVQFGRCYDTGLFVVKLNGVLMNNNQSLPSNFDLCAPFHDTNGNFFNQYPVSVTHVPFGHKGAITIHFLVWHWTFHINWS